MHTRSLYISLLVYWFIVALIHDLLNDPIHCTIFTFSRLGLMVNWEASQQVQFIGASLNTITGKEGFLPADRTKSIKVVVLSCIRNCWQPVEIIQQLLELMALTTTMILLARLHIWKLQIWFKKYDPNRHPTKCCFFIPRVVVKSLQWWVYDTNLVSGPQVTLITDASLLG